MSRLKQALPLAGTGAALGLAFFGLEELLHLLLGEPHLQALQILQLLPFYVLLPAIAGLILSFIGFKGVAGNLWLSACMAVLFLIGPAIAAWGWIGALPALIGPPLVIVATLYLTRKKSDGFRWAMVPAGLAWLLFAAVLNVSSIPDTFSSTGAIVNLGLLVMAGALVASVGKALGDRSPRLGVMAALLALLVWPVRLLVSSPTSRDLPTTQGSEHPAFLLVVVDGLRADQVGFLNAKTGSNSPNLDALAERGFSYTAQAGAPAGLPAMASLLTGLNPSTHKAGVNGKLTADHRTIVEYAADQGYTTGAVISQELYGRGSGIEQGFGYYEVFTGMGHRPALLSTLDLMHVPALSKRHYAGAERITDRALEFLETRKGQGWLLMVEYADLLGPSEQSYQADLRLVDGQIQRLLGSVSKDTWVFVVGSHGLSFGEHDPAQTSERASTEALWQENLAVPLIAYRPRNNDPASQLRTVQTQDLVPTLLDLMDADLRIGVDGDELFEVFHRPSPEAGSPAIAETADGSQKALRSGEWKVRWQQEPTALQLYNLVLDPGETQDVAAQFPNQAADLAQGLSGVDWPAPPDGWDAPEEPEPSEEDPLLDLEMETEMELEPETEK
jgi:arylsulfatase A-like enzyme